MRQYAFEGPCQGVPYYYTRPRHEVLPFPRRSASFITESHLFVNEHFSDFRESFSRLQDISGTSGVKVSCIFQKKSALRVRFFFLNIWVGRSRWKFAMRQGSDPYFDPVESPLLACQTLDYFGTVPQSMFSLFCVMTLEGWPGLLHSRCGKALALCVQRSTNRFDCIFEVFSAEGSRHCGTAGGCFASSPYRNALMCS